MRRTICILALGLSSAAPLAGTARADVILRGPFGGLIVVPSSSDVRVGPGGVAVVPAPVPVAPQQQTLPPAPVPYVPAPQPAVVAAVLPQDFVKTFKPAAGSYQVVFVHPRSGREVTVSFVLPAGNPRVYYVPGSLVFDYGRHEVEIRFRIGGGVAVLQR
jgi:hypothetical protein